MSLFTAGDQMDEYERLDALPGDLRERVARIKALVENDECHWNMDGPPESDCVDVLVSDLRAILSLIQSERGEP